MAALADGLTTIRSPLIARETTTMIEACRSLGAEVSLSGDRLEVRGIGPEFSHAPPTSGGRSHYIWASGSALVARLFIIIGSALPESIIVDGKCNLRTRPFEPLMAALRSKGVELAFLDTPDRLPCKVLSSALPGGHYLLRTDISSQFATSLLVAAPLAEGPLTVELTGPNYSISYIRQTVDMMRRFGVNVEAEQDMSRMSVPCSQTYQARDVDLRGDYTSASYIAGAAFVTRGHIRLDNLDPASMQGERAIIDILRELGADVRWIQGSDALIVDCSRPLRPVDATFDVSDCPNIVPTVAAIAATVPGRTRIEGGRLTQNHKSRRIDAIAAELSRAGVSLRVLRSEDGLVDGLEINGTELHAGGAVFSAHEDHRIAMSLIIFSLACEQPCSFSRPVDTADSFPEFQDHLGITASAVRPKEVSAS